jgi:hypothetical protein
VTSARTVVIIAALTLREASRRRVLLALAVLTVALLGLSGWGFSRLAAESSEFSTLTSGEARLAASQLLNLVMFGFSLMAALGPPSSPAHAVRRDGVGHRARVLARPVRRSAVLLGKWLGLVVFGSGFIVLAGLAQCVVVWATVDYWPPQPAVALALLAAQTTVLLTLAVLLSTAVSPMASGVVAVGLFGATWVAGVVGGAGRRSTTRASSASARSRGSCCPRTACGAARCTPSRTPRRSPPPSPPPRPSRS